MKASNVRPAADTRAFTLVELLVVIAIISILAALIVPLARNAADTQRKNRAKTELGLLQTALEQYKSARGHYPPDNTNNAARPPLFYELTGTVYTNSGLGRTYWSLYQGMPINRPTALMTFGVEAFINAAQVGNAADAAQIRETDVKNCLNNLRSGQYLTNNDGAAFLGLPIDGPDEIVTSDGRRINPWRYNSSNPTNNTDTYDLWVDITLRNGTNRICNWSGDSIVLH